MELGDEDPLKQRYPALQGPLQLAELRPGEFPYLPTGQGAHTAAPPRLYLPGIHTLRLVSVVAELGHSKPAVQPMQLEAPMELKKPG